eukprot:scaffold291_cov223-Pinguiococcus_pyrenoidosus.AAC.1
MSGTSSDTACRVLPDDFQVLPKKGRASLIDKHGLRATKKDAVNVPGRKTKVWWFCSLCNFQCLVHEATSLALNHLQKNHNITSARNQQLLALQKEDDEGYAVLKRVSTKRNTLVSFAYMLIENFLVFQLVQSRSFRRFACRINDWEPRTTTERVRDVVIEVYHALFNTIKTRIAEAREAHSMSRWIHVSLDLWSSKVTKEKYVGIRIFYLAKDWSVQSDLLACTLWRPLFFLDRSQLGEREGSGGS